MSLPQRGGPLFPGGYNTDRNWLPLHRLCLMFPGSQNPGLWLPVYDSSWKRFLPSFLPPLHSSGAGFYSWILSVLFFPMAILPARILLTQSLPTPSLSVQLLPSPFPPAWLPFALPLPSPRPRTRFPFALLLPSPRPRPAHQRPIRPSVSYRHTSPSPPSSSGS